MSTERPDDFDFEQDTAEVGATPSETVKNATGQEETPAHEPPSQEGIVGFFKRNWLYLGIGVIVFFVVWYLYSSIFSSPPAPPAKTQKPVATSPATQWVNAPNSQAKAAPPGTTVESGITLGRNDLKTMIDGFNQSVSAQLTALVQEINQVQEGYGRNQATLIQAQQKTVQVLDENQHQMDFLKGELSATNEKLEQYNKTLTELTNTLSKTQKQLTLLVAEKADQADQLKLRAIVPGRAWLVNADGVTLSVVEGTVLPNYGAVTRVDSDAGKVYTSSGYVFN